MDRWRASSSDPLPHVASSVSAVASNATPTTEAAMSQAVGGSYGDGSRCSARRSTA